MTTMIALVGEQTLPNYLPILHYQPSDVVLVYTTRTQPHYERLKVVLQRDVNVRGLAVHPYDISSITSLLNEELAKLALSASRTLVFNLTGGTKTMLLAAYQIAQQRETPILYLQRVVY